MIDVILLRNHLTLLVLIWLPCAYLDERIVSIAEVDHQEQIAFVAISVGMPILLEGDSVDVVVFGVLYHVDVLKLDVYKLGGLEYIAQVAQIFLLGLFDIYHLII